MGAQRNILIIGDDSVTRQMRCLLAQSNVLVLDAAIATTPTVRIPSLLPNPLPSADCSRMAAAEAKRERRAAKRQARAAQLDGGQEGSAT